MRTLTLAIMAFTVGCKSETDINDNTEETPEEISDASGLTHLTNGTSIIWAELGPTTDENDGVTAQFRIEVDTTESPLYPEGIFYWFSDELNGQMTVEEIYEEETPGEDGSFELISGITAYNNLPFLPAGGITITAYPYSGTTALGALNIGFYCSDTGAFCEADWE